MYFGGLLKTQRDKKQNCIFSALTGWWVLFFTPFRPSGASKQVLGAPD